MPANDGPLTEAQWERFAYEVVAASGADGIDDAALAEAAARLCELCAGAQLFEMWAAGRVVTRWDAEEKDLIFTLRGSADSEGTP